MKGTPKVKGIYYITDDDHLKITAPSLVKVHPFKTSEKNSSKIEAYVLDPSNVDLEYSNDARPYLFGVLHLRSRSHIVNPL